MRTTIVAAALVLALGAAAQADDPPTIKERTQNQRDRIQQGVQNGELTRKEANRLRDQQRDIQEQRAEAREDGVVTTRERQDIKEEQREQSQRIWKQKHDPQDRD